jgi:predicted PurR-regulated permease PerM
MKLIEKNIFLNIRLINKNKKLVRGLSAFSTFAVTFSVIIWLMRFFIPELIENLQPLYNLISVVSDSAPKYIPILDQTLEEFLRSMESFEDLLNEINSFFSVELLKIEDVMSYLEVIPDFFNKIISSAINLVLAIMIAFYMLCDKESIANNIQKILFVFFKRPLVEKILFLGSETNSVFEKFIVGKAVDSLIIGIIFFIGGLILKLPFLTIISFIICVTNMIPYFGPFLGAIPSILLVLLNNLTSGTSIMQTIWLAIFIFVLQQVDGIIIGPKILGDSTGLKPLGVIFSIIVGGALFGVLGMFLGVPFFALITNLFYSYVNKNYYDKQINNEPINKI